MIKQLANNVFFASNSHVLQGVGSEGWRQQMWWELTAAFWLRLWSIQL
jgi:hypothetical protein